MSDQTLINAIRSQSGELRAEPTDQRAGLRKLDGIRAVLFDIYGTLLISASGEVGTASEDEVRRDVVMAAVTAAGGHWQGGQRPDSTCLVDAVQGSHRRSQQQGVEYPEVDIVEIWRELLADFHRQGLLAAGGMIDPARVAVEYEVRTNPVWPMPGLEGMLADLAAAGLTLGIISNAQFYTPLIFPALLQKSLEKLAFDPQMQYYSYRLREAKPGQALYRQARQELTARGITPGEALYMGNDMLNDITPASRLGFRTALFAGDRRSLRLRTGDARVAGVRPDLVVTDLASLVTCVTR